MPHLSQEYGRLRISPVPIPIAGRSHSLGLSDDGLEAWEKCLTTARMELHRLLAKLMFTIPAVALGMWSPSLVGAAKLSAQVQDGYRTLASQWQSFVGRRLREDF